MRTDARGNARSIASSIAGSNAKRMPDAMPKRCAGCYARTDVRYLRRHITSKKSWLRNVTRTRANRPSISTLLAGPRTLRGANPGESR